MATKIKTPKRPAADPEPKEPEVMLRIRSLLEKFEQQIRDGDFKMSVADYIRLIQMKHDLDDTTPQNIEVTWVDSLDVDGRGEQ